MTRWRIILCSSSPKTLVQVEPKVGPKRVFKSCDRDMKLGVWLGLMVSEKGPFVPRHSWNHSFRYFVLYRNSLLTRVNTDSLRLLRARAVPPSIGVGKTSLWVKNRLDMVPRVRARLSEEDCAKIKPGSVFAYSEEESGIKRWTDGRYWTSGRPYGAFIMYREKVSGGRHRRSQHHANQPHHVPGGFARSSSSSSSSYNHQSGSGSGSGSGSRSSGASSSGTGPVGGPPTYRTTGALMPGGMVKRTISVDIHGWGKFHLVCYQQHTPASAAKLLARRRNSGQAPFFRDVPETPSQLEMFQSIPLSPEIYPHLARSGSLSPVSVRTNVGNRSPIDDGRQEGHYPDDATPQINSGGRDHDCDRDRDLDRHLPIPLQPPADGRTNPPLSWRRSTLSEPVRRPRRQRLSSWTNYQSNSPAPADYSWNYRMGMMRSESMTEGTTNSDPTTTSIFQYHPYTLSDSTGPPVSPTQSSSSTSQDRSLASASSCGPNILPSLGIPTMLHQSFAADGDNSGMPSQLPVPLTPEEARETRLPDLRRMVGDALDPTSGEDVADPFD